MFATGIFFNAKKSEKIHEEKLPEDTALAFRAADGDEAAFEQLVKKYERFVSTCAYSVTENAEDALDVSQEVFLKVYRSLPSFKGESSFSTWLYRVAKNCAYDFARKKKPASVSLDAEDEDGNSMDLPDSDEKVSPEALALKKERSELLWRAIGRLSDEHREAITLRDINGLTYEQIAEITSLEVGTVKSRLFRAREALKKQLEKENYF